MKDRDFPIGLGILFLEKRKKGKGFIHFKRSLKFDKDACSYLILQSNAMQELFQFNIVIPEPKDDPMPSIGEIEKELEKGKLTEGKILDWFEGFVTRISKDEYLRNNIGAWIGITSKRLPNNRFATARSKDDAESKSKKNIALMTTDKWERSFSPPSVFEYIIFVIFKMGLFFLYNDFEHSSTSSWELIHHHKSITRGCIFDFTKLKAHRRFSISTPKLCLDCTDKIRHLEQIINKKNGVKISVYECISKVLSKEWMGSPEVRGTPLFNLKKDYKYDIDRNSGLYKNFFEKFRDSTVDNLPQWIVGTLISGVVGGLLLIFGLNK